MAPLQGIGVLVTRPEQQAAALCGLLQAQGATTLRLPAIEIKPLPDPRARMNGLEAFDVAIFTSTNAVRYGACLLEANCRTALAAIGPATARALRERGHAVTLEPRGGYTAEALLARLQSERLAGRRVLMIKGLDGRQLLEAQLAGRGAKVTTVDVYQRVPAVPSAADLAAAQAGFALGRLQVITATSLDVGKRLLEIVPEELRVQFHKALWLVPGERVAHGLRDLGLAAPMLSAASAEDQDLVAALVRWRSSESEA